MRARLAVRVPVQSEGGGKGEGDDQGESEGGWHLHGELMVGLLTRVRVRVRVRVHLHGELMVGLLDLACGGGAVDAERLVVINLAQPLDPLLELRVGGRDRCSRWGGGLWPGPAVRGRRCAPARSSVRDLLVQVRVRVRIGVRVGVGARTCAIFWCRWCERPCRRCAVRSSSSAA